MSKTKDLLASKDPEMRRLGQTLKEEERRKGNMHYDVIQKIQKQNPYAILTGSAALYLYGLKLERHKYHNGDIDLIVPFYFKFKQDSDLRIDHDYIKPESKDFDYGLEINNINVDIKIDASQMYKEIEFEDVTYKVALLDHILIAKLKYANKNKKHMNDIEELLGIEQEEHSIISYNSGS